MGKVEITVVAARRLHDMQLVGIPDPFVRITCGDRNYKTKVTKDTLNPEWNETFRFMIPDENSTQIRAEVWNKNTYNDDLMGTYTLSLGGLTRGIVKDDWFILDKSKTQAELRLRILAIDFGVPPKSEEQWMVTADITKDPVQRAIEDGRWRLGQKAAPVPTGPPPAQAPSFQTAVPGQPTVTMLQPSPQVPYVQAPLPPQQFPNVSYTPQQQGPPPVHYVTQHPPVPYVQQPPPQGYYPPQPMGYPPQQQPQPGYYAPYAAQQQPAYAPPQSQMVYPPRPGYY